MNRRDFVKNITALAAAGAFGIKLTGGDVNEVIEIVDYVLDEDAIMACMTFGSVTEQDGKLGMEIAFYSERAMDAVTFIDSKGREYSYQEIEEMVG